MTLQQLRCAVTAAEEGTISKAAEKLFISQPSLSASIHELEKELGITIFQRTNRGVVVSRAGEEFLGHARQILLQISQLEERYTGQEPVQRDFSVSSQHFAFVARAFANTIRKADSSRYVFSFHEELTWEVIEDVSNMRSEIGVLSLSDFSSRYLLEVFRKNNLVFHELARVPAQIYVAADHPLAGRDVVTEEDLSAYPCVIYDQGESNALYLSESALSTYHLPRQIRVRDRATAYDMVDVLRGFTSDPGVGRMDPAYVSVPLPAQGDRIVGYLTKKGMLLSTIAESFLEELKKLCNKQGNT